MAEFDLLSETKACDLLARLFRARGYTIARNISFREYGVSFHIDGWDAKARVGFEFLTSEDEDHDAGHGRRHAERQDQNARLIQFRRAASHRLLRTRPEDPRKGRNEEGRHASIPAGRQSHRPAEAGRRQRRDGRQDQQPEP